MSISPQPAIRKSELTSVQESHSTLQVASRLMARVGGWSSELSATTRMSLDCRYQRCELSSRNAVCRFRSLQLTLPELSVAAVSLELTQELARVRGKNCGRSNFRKLPLVREIFTCQQNS